ncbi:hypothetical protein COU79_00595 [Candidatus Peregrinibacteria bacterium CG10_big_fil_rev_8_21_14_0_10_54_7]|nr:MAG: hypothetical protein COU79_00595 [Candidatus Peregrinibacteria bacterium CG10_big_fil_rev_8_21_14_0_10_54_7]
MESSQSERYSRLFSHFILPNIFALIGTSWDFYKSQPVLNAVLLWFLVLPITAESLLTEYQVNQPYFQDITWEGVASGQTNPNLFIATVLFEIVLILLLVWGMACCTLVGKRLLQNRAGRARTSFRAVSRQARRFVMSLILTDILRGCFTFFWALLLIIPGIIYQIRTFFYFIAIVCEGKEYRSALQESRGTVQGFTWTVLWYILGLSAAVFLPLIVIDTVLTEAIYRLDERLLPATYLVSSFLFGIGTLLFILSSISLYAQLKKMKPQKVQE